MKTIKRIILTLIAIAVMITVSFAGICTQKHLSRVQTCIQPVFDHVSDGYGNMALLY